MTKKNVLLIYGGKSTEHEVSVRSARNIARAIDPNRFNTLFIGVDKSGVWHVKTPQDLETEDVVQTVHSQQVVVYPGKASDQILKVTDLSSIGSIDVAFSIIHGTGGEDGTIQSMLKTLNIPFVGPGVMSSAICLDKEITKQLLDRAGIPNSKYLAYRMSERAAINFETVKAALGTPVYIKPPNLGSSVGISRASTKDEFDAAIDLAFQYDRKVLIEANVVGRELECAVWGNHTIEAAAVGEVITNSETHDFYDYEAKYEDANGAQTSIVSDLPTETIDEIRNLAIKTYRCLNCEGMARVDVFLQDDGKILVNEVNTIPGFTDISMYPQLWKAKGFTYSEVIEKLLGLAIDRFEEEVRMNQSL